MWCDVEMSSVVLRVQQRGYCDLDKTVQHLLSVDVEKCKKLMISSGLNSFGKPDLCKNNL